MLPSLLSGVPLRGRAGPSCAGSFGTGVCINIVCAIQAAVSGESWFVSYASPDVPICLAAAELGQKSPGGFAKLPESIFHKNENSRSSLKDAEPKLMFREFWSLP